MSHSADLAGATSSRSRIDPRRLLLTALSLGGYLAGAAMYMSIHSPLSAPGVDLQAYLGAGAAFLAGLPVYVDEIGQSGAFAYAPTWAIIFAALSWLPADLVQMGVVVLDLGAIRYVAGSWRATGYVLWIPLVILVISAGNVDLLIAAAIVLAWRRTGAPLTVLGLSKVAPFLGLPIPWRREVWVTLGVCFLITLPWLGLWIDWIDYLIRQPTTIRISLPLGPWWFRLPIALALLIPRKSYLSGLAVVVAMPSLYLSTLVILIAPLRLWLDDRRGRLASSVRGLSQPTSTEPARSLETG